MTPLSPPRWMGDGDSPRWAGLAAQSWHQRLRRPFPSPVVPDAVVALALPGLLLGRL